MRLRRFLCLGLLLLPLAAAARADSPPTPWKALSKGHVVAVMRHALAPGTGDPAGFDPADCASQRNLNDAGRAQARAIGDAFRAAGFARAQVYSSAWCRCRQTATLLGLGPVTVMPALNSFFRDRDRAAAQTAELKAFLDAQDMGGPIVMVTHQVNIAALTGIYPQSGELVFVSADGDAAPLARAVPAAP